jgi:hypothetical protein
VHTSAGTASPAFVQSLESWQKAYPGQSKPFFYLQPKGLNVKKADRDLATAIAQLTATYEYKPFDSSDQQPRIYDPYYADAETLAYIDRYWTIHFFTVDVAKALALYQEGGNMCLAVDRQFVDRLETKLDADHQTAGMGRGRFKVVRLSTQPCEGSDPSRTLTISTKSGIQFTFYILLIIIIVEVCDGPWIAAVIHPWPVNANMHVASQHSVIIRQPGYFGIYGGTGSLGKARATTHGQATTSDHPGVCWHAGKGRWQASIGIDGKDIYLGYFVGEVEAKAMYDKVLPIVQALHSKGKDPAAIIASVHAATLLQDMCEDLCEHGKLEPMQI